jgi:hypothetical protein
MSPTDRSPLRDPELVEMLSDEPELLALADALVATTKPLSGRRRRRRMVPHNRPLVASASSAAATVAALVALFLISPWQTSPSFVQRALAAVGAQPVLHVVTSQPAPAGTLVDVKSGQPVSEVLRTEVWFDRGRELKKSAFTINGKTLDEALETKAGSWTRGGPIYTCAWIAAHPTEATKARVSCNANGDNGTTPRTVPESAPELDPALAGFVDRYQAALASGAARRIGAGQFEGHDIVWLQFDADGRTEQVAVDAQSYKPLLIKQEPGDVSLRVLIAETLPYQSAIFRKPTQIRAQSGGSLSAETAITPQQAAATLGGKALWLGESWNDLRLVATTREVRTISYGPDEPSGRADIVNFTYAKLAPGGAVDGQSQIHIYESQTCIVNLGWTCTASDPADAGTIELRGPIGILRKDDLFVAIWDWSSNRQRGIDIARTLSSVPAAN